MKLNSLTNFLKGNPELLSKYVAVGFTLVDKTVSPLNKLMQHLLEIQGIDPATQPGDRARKALSVAIDHVDDSEEYDHDFNFSRFHGKYEKVKGALKHLNLSKDEYRKMTDLSKVDDVYPALIPQNSDRPELRIFEAERKTTNPLEDLEAFTKDLSPSLETAKPFTASGNLNIAALKDALKTLKKYANDMDNPSNSKTELLKELSQKVKAAGVEVGRVNVSRQPAMVGRTKVTKGESKVVKSFKRGVFRRVEDK